MQESEVEISDKNKAVDGAVADVLSPLRAGDAAFLPATTEDHTLISTKEVSDYTAEQGTQLEGKDGESDDENDDETKENYEGFNGTGRTVTLQMLMGANVLQPGKSLMTIEYLGQKFVGDLLPDGKIKSQETETIFLTPSAWAMHCKRIINPEKKSGCGWASVKYKGKKLDAYKNSWLRKCALQKESTPDEGENDVDKKSDSPIPAIKRNVFQHNAICNRNVMHDANMLIEAVPFSSVGKLQPFLLTISSSALLLADFHCHLTMHEVCGYLGGTWDFNSHTLVITKAYPCRNSRFDRLKACDVEREIQKMMGRDQLILAGWYHSHPKFQAEPTLRDCDSQLDYQIRMRGPSEVTYTPCVALIVSPYYDENPTLESVVKSIWIVPPNENKHSMEYGRPMLMQYSVLPDKEIPEEVRNEIQTCVDYYSQFRNEIVKFGSIYSEDITFIEKLKNTLYPKFPLKQNDKALWNWICAVLDCEQEDDFIPPKTIKIIDKNEELKPSVPLSDASICDVKGEEVKDELVAQRMSCAATGDSIAQTAEEQSQAEQKANELKVLSLQEQLCLPSGLNMNPVRMLSPLATPNPTGVPTTLPPIIPQVAVPATATSGLLPPLPPSVGPLPLATSNLPQSNQFSTTGSLRLSSTSPRDSPITIPSNSASPAKFEIPIRASPSPAKSDTSSHTSRTRNSPAPSPGKFSISDIARNSPSITPNKYEPPTSLVQTTTACLQTANDIMAASLAQLAEQLPPNFLEDDIAALFRPQQRKDYGNSSLNQLAAAAAKAGNQKQAQSLDSNRGGGGLGVSAGIGVGGGPGVGVGSATDISDPNVSAAVAAYSNNFNLPPRVPDTLPHQSQQQTSLGGGNVGGKSKLERNSKPTSISSSSSANSTNSYKTKLMKELDDLKNDPMKMGELMRSPEYAALLLQQAEALGATTLGTLGLGADFSYLAGAGLGLHSGGGGASMTTSNSSKSKSSAAAAAAASAAASAAALTADYNNLIQASKLLGYDSYMQQAKTNDLNAFLQQQMGAAAAAAAAAAVSVAPPASPSGSKKQQQQQQSLQPHPDYTTLLQTYSKLFDPGNQFGAAMAPAKTGSSAHHELSALLAAGVGGVSSVPTAGASSASMKHKQKDVQAQSHHQQSDMLNQLLQSEKQQSDLNVLLYHQNKAPTADLNALFTAPSAANVAAAASTNPSSSKAVGSSSGSTGAPSPLTDPAAYYNALAQEKMQDYAAFFQQQHGKYNIPDPLSKSTLAANNLFMSPSALLKIQQESLSAMMMKPPKSTASSTSSMGRTRESSASPALERLTPTKIGTSNSGGSGGSKYNFSAVDLAISSVTSNTPSPALSDGSNSSSHRRPSNTPPVDLSRLYGELAPPVIGGMTTKKRMEFSSIADLAAPPPAKLAKTSDDVLNLSNE